MCGRHYKYVNDKSRHLCRPREKERRREKANRYIGVSTLGAQDRCLVLYERIPRHINNYYTHSLPLYFRTRRRIRPVGRHPRRHERTVIRKGAIVVRRWRLARGTEFLIVRAMPYNDLCGCISSLDEETTRFTASRFFRDRSQRRIMDGVLRELIYPRHARLFHRFIFSFGINL